MSRWYQNVLTGEQREVKTLAEDDYYVDNAPNWARIKAPSPAPPTPSAGDELASVAEEEPEKPKRQYKRRK